MLSQVTEGILKYCKILSTLRTPGSGSMMLTPDFNTYLRFLAIVKSEKPV